MPSPLPCQGGTDGHDSCPLPKPCKYIQQQPFRKRDPEWIAAHCEELKARKEGWQEVGG